MRRDRRSDSVTSSVVHCLRTSTSSPERSMVSAKRRIAVRGVRSSWLTFETKSAWSSERFASRRMNTSTSTTPVTTTEMKLTDRMPKRRLIRDSTNIWMMPIERSRTVGMMTR